MNDAQHWRHLSLRLLTSNVVKEASSLREDHDVHLEGLCKSNNFQIVTVDACFGHCLHVLFVGSVDFFGCRSSGDGRSSERAVVLAFWISTSATAGMDN